LVRCTATCGKAASGGEWACPEFTSHTPTMPERKAMLTFLKACSGDTTCTTPTRYGGPLGAFSPKLLRSAVQPACSFTCGGALGISSSWKSSVCCRARSCS